MSATLTTRKTIRPATAWRAGAITLLVGGLASLLVWSVARLAGADFTVTRADGTGMTIGPVAIVATVLVTVLLGTVVLALAVRRTEAARGVLAWSGLVLAVLTVPMPFTMDGDTGARVALALMHVIVGGTWFAVVRGTPAGPDHLAAGPVPE